MGLLDRETAQLRYFAKGREDSLAMSIVAPMPAFWCDITAEDAVIEMAAACAMFN